MRDYRINDPAPLDAGLNRTNVQNGVALQK